MVNNGLARMERHRVDNGCLFEKGAAAEISHQTQRVRRTHYKLLLLSTALHIHTLEQKTIRRSRRCPVMSCIRDYFLSDAAAADATHTCKRGATHFQR